MILAETTCIVTGAGAGVGKGVATALAMNGANVIIAARRAENGQPTADEINERAKNGDGETSGHATFVKCDVNVQADIESAVSQAVEIYGRLDCFIHNALSSAGTPMKYIETLEEAWEAMNATAVRPCYYSARAAHSELKKTNGSLVLVSSSAGVEGSGSLPIYGAVKAAQRSIAKSLAKEWGPDVRVNLLNPVAMTPAMERGYKKNPELEERLLSRTPLGYIGDPENDIGQATVFLASQLSRYVTGQTLTVDGGNFMGL